MIVNWAVCIAALFVVSCAQQIDNFGPCTTPGGESALCIPLDQCAELNNIVQQARSNTPLSEKDKQFLKQSQCGMHNKTVVVCCSRKMLLPEPGVCGRLKQGRIFGGNVTKLDEYPWMALIMYTQFDESMGHHCGGSLINDRYVLTAAHCMKCIPEFWKPSHVRLGEWDTTSNPDCQWDVNNNTFCADEIIEVPIEKIIIHPSYQLNSINQFSDIALIRLSYSIAYTDYIEPICLPLKDILKRSTFEGIVMDVVGWGKTEQGFTRSNKKLKAGVPVVPLEDCQRVYRSPRLGKGKRNLKSSQLCAGGDIGVDSCGGDSGGPLIGEDSSDKTLVYNFIAGIISYGPVKCGMQGWPSVYTKVSDYLDWILENIEP